MLRIRRNYHIQLCSCGARDVADPATDWTAAPSQERRRAELRQLMRADQQYATTQGDRAGQLHGRHRGERDAVVNARTANMH